VIERIAASASIIDSDVTAEATVEERRFSAAESKNKNHTGFNP
jgi:hypothetical protein